MWFPPLSIKDSCGSTVRAYGMFIGFALLRLPGGDELQGPIFTDQNGDVFLMVFQNDDDKGIVSASFRKVTGADVFPFPEPVKFALPGKFEMRDFLEYLESKTAPPPPPENQGALFATDDASAPLSPSPVQSGETLEEPLL